MRKMTPMILVILMLASVLSSIDVYELQEQNEFEETSARSGADPEVVYVTSPRETLYAGDDATNVMLAGETINFKAYLRNSGDADLTNMQYQVTVYESDGGERGDVAKDLNGNDLSWANDKAVCSNSCQNSVLTPGEFIDGGESTLVTTAGSVIQWTPYAGSYFVEVKVTSQVLGDPGNDEISFPVLVKDWHDIEVDLTWLDENGNEVNGAVDGEGDVDFKLTVNLAGSMGFMNLRNTTVSVTVTGGTVQSSSGLTLILGEERTVEISDDGNGNSASELRMLIGADENGSNTVPLVGESIMTLTPDAGVAVDYEVSVAIESYTVYGAEGCSSTIGTCERLIAGVDAEDEFSGNNQDSISGSSDPVNDITLFDYYLSSSVSGDSGEEGDENTEGLSDRYGFVGGEVTETLSTGEYDLVAVVMHTASSASALYEWSVTFTITDSSDGSTTVIDADKCESQEYPDHKVLGEATDRTDADFIGTACATHTFDAGEFNVEAMANLVGLVDDADGSVDTRATDAILINNKEDYTITVENFEPSITTFKSNIDNALVGDTVTVQAVAFDVEGDRLDFTWADGSGNALACADANDAIAGECTFTILQTMIPSLEVRVELTDGYNVVDSILNINVAINLQFTASGLADGFNAVYSVTLKSSALDVTFADGPLDEVSTGSCANSATPVGSVTVNPTSAYGSSVVLDQTIHIHFPNDLGIQHMWMEAGNTVVSVASGAGDEVDASTSGYTYNFPSGSDSIPPGTHFHLIADDCETPNPPSGTITQLTATAEKGGDIVIAYNYDALLSDENVRIEVTMAGGSTPEVTYDRVESDTRSVTWASGSNGQAYTVTAQLCNQYACGDSVSTPVTSDSSVAAVTASSVTITESGENWVVAWEPSVVDDDVTGWYVCYNRGEFTATEMKVMVDADACTMVMQGTEATIAKYTTVETTQVHFGIVPHDGVMNVAYGPSTDSILYDRSQDTTNPDDGTTTTDSEASSGVPTWTWGVIGAVVVVAFVVGAFILSRGEGEDDDDKEWDY